MIDDRYLLVRGAAIYVTALLTAAAVLWRRPDQRTLAGALLAFAWNLPALLMVHVVAIAAGWWSYDADGGVLLGMPVDLWLAWAVLWGPVPAIAMPRAPLWAIAALALRRRSRRDARGGTSGAARAVVADWRIRQHPRAACCRHNCWRDGRAPIGISPRARRCRSWHSAACSPGSSRWWRLKDPAPPGSIRARDRRGSLSLAAQCLAVPGILGLSAVQEFVTRGRGTPVPFDPPRHIVTTGVYAYVANPMQLSAVLFLLLLAVIVGNVWVAAAALIAHVYSVGLAGWDEDEDLRTRFGADWPRYTQRVRKWIPRWRPWYGETAIATLYVSAECGMCRQVANWFEARHVRGLAIVAAEECPTPLMRITYQSTDGTYTASGIARDRDVRSSISTWVGPLRASRCECHSCRT